MCYYNGKIMPTVNFEKDGVELHLYGDVHVSVDTNGLTKVDMGACKVVRIRPPGKFTLESLVHRRIASIMPDDLTGHIYFRDPELPFGIEDEPSLINIPPRARLKIMMPVDPD